VLIIPISARLLHEARPTPTAAASVVQTAASVSSCRMIRPRPAPIASRSASFAARRSARDEQIRRAGARDSHQQTDERQQQPERLLELVSHPRVSGAASEQPCPAAQIHRPAIRRLIAPGRRLEYGRPDCLQRSVRLRQAEILPDPAEQVDRRRRMRLKPGGALQALHRHERRHNLGREPRGHAEETGRHDADNRERLALDPHRAADGRRGGAPNRRCQQAWVMTATRPWTPPPTRSSSGPKVRPAAASSPSITNKSPEALSTVAGSGSFAHSTCVSVRSQPERRSKTCAPRARTSWKTPYEKAGFAK
jgi:hypothetical protein